jgi:hypothetical protein
MSQVIPSGHRCEGLYPNGVEGTSDGLVESGGQAVGFVSDVRDDVVVTSALEALARGARLWLVANVAGIGVAATVVETTIRYGRE